MRKLFIALTTMLCLSLSGCAFPSSMPAQRNAVVTLTENGDSVCTGYALARREVLTASHCLSPITQVGGLPVEELARDGHDHSLLCVHVDLKPIASHVTAAKVQPGDVIHFWGHAGGNPLLYRQGAMAGQVMVEGKLVTLFDANGFNGDSGAPLFNSYGQLVGTVMGRYSIKDWKMLAIYPYAFTPDQWKRPCP